MQSWRVAKNIEIRMKIDDIVIVFFMDYMNYFTWTLFKKNDLEKDDKCLVN